MRIIGGALALSVFYLAVSGISSAQGDGALNATLDYISPEANLFFLDPGFMDVSSANGVAGVRLNPAALASIKNGEIGIAGGLPRSTTLRYDLDLIQEDESGTLPEGLSMPFNLRLLERGGIDYFGAAGRFKWFAFGGTVMRGESYGLDVDLDGEVEQNFSLVIEDTLTHDDFPEIPETDTIPVNWPIEGIAKVRFSGEGGGRASITPAFLGTGVGWGPAKMGLGLNVTRYSGDLDLLLNVNSKGSAFIGGVDTTSAGWTVDVDVEAELADEEIAAYELQGKMSGTQLGFVFGLMADLWIVDMGLAVERSFPFELTGDYEARFVSPAGPPQTIEIDTSGVDVDTIGKEISGEAVIRFSDFELDDTTHSDQGIFRFGNRTAVRAGGALNLWFIRLAVGAGGDIYQQDQSNLGVYHVCGSGALNFKPVTLRAGVVGRWQLIQFEDWTPPILPHVIFGLGTSVEISPVTVDLVLRTNLFPTLVKTMASIEAEEGIDPFSTLNLGAGVRYRF